jgi:hypothetical protein
LDKLARRKRTPLFVALQSANIQLLQTQGATFFPVGGTLFIPLDFDVTPMDNTGSHKEGVEQTYKKGVEGYAPMMTYIGGVFSQPDGFTVAFHGYPRYTKDIDFWRWADPENAERIIKAIGEFGLGSLGLQASDFLNP